MTRLGTGYVTEVPRWIPKMDSLSQHNFRHASGDLDVRRFSEALRHASAVLRKRSDAARARSRALRRGESPPTVPEARDPIEGGTVSMGTISVTELF
jgi:hypothetical protein